MKNESGEWLSKILNCCVCHRVAFVAVYQDVPFGWTYDAWLDESCCPDCQKTYQLRRKRLGPQRQTNSARQG